MSHKILLLLVPELLFLRMITDLSIAQTLPPLSIYDRAEFVQHENTTYVRIHPTSEPWETEDAGTVYIDNWPLYNMRIAEKLYNPDRWEFKDYWIGGEWIPSFSRGDYIIESYAANMVYLFHMIFVRYVPVSGPFSLKDVFQFFIYSDSTGKDPNDTFEYIAIHDVPFIKGQKIRWFAYHLFEPKYGLKSGMHFWVHPEGDSTYYGYNPNTALYTNNFYRFYIGCGSHGTVYFPQFPYKREPACGDLRVFFGSQPVPERTIQEWLRQKVIPKENLLSFPIEGTVEKDYPVQLPEHEWIYERRMGQRGLTRLSPSGGSVEPSRPKRILTLSIDEGYRHKDPVKIYYPITEHFKTESLVDKTWFSMILRDSKIDGVYDLKIDVSLVVLKNEGAEADSFTIRLNPDLKDRLLFSGDTLITKIIPADNEWTFLNLDLQALLDEALYSGLTPEKLKIEHVYRVSLAGDLKFTDIILSKDPLNWSLAITTSVSPPKTESIPKSYTLHAFPNPAKRSVRFQVPIQNSAHVTVTVYSILGRKVVQLTSDRYSPQILELEWNGEDQNGDHVPSGSYIAKYQIGGKIGWTHFTLLK